MTRADFELLLSAEGAALLAEVGALKDTGDVLGQVTRLRAAGHSPQLVAAVLTQAKLRRRAVAKFGDFAAQMLFTEDGLEQASRLSVAAQHAERFRAAGLTRVADLGCGIGSQSMAIASLDMQVQAFDIDEVAAAAATHNLRFFENANVTCLDVTTLDPTNSDSAIFKSTDAYFFDPARRELGGSKRERAVRKFDPSEYSPNFDFVLAAARAKPTGIKLGPGHPHEAIPEDCEAQWISVDGDLVECTLWFGDALARKGVARSALLIGKTGRHELTSASFERVDAPIGELGEFIYEPDAAIIRSHLIGDLALQLGLRIFSNEIAYLTGDQDVDSPWLKKYRLIDNLVFDRKKLKALLRERGIGVLEIKKRGADIVPEQLRKELDLKGKGAATLIITRVGDAHRALLAEHIPKVVAAQ